MDKNEIPQSVTLAVIGDGDTEKRYEDLTFADDFMFGKIMANKDVCKKFLEILLGIDPDTEIADPVSQESLSAAPGAKSIRVDIRTHDERNDYDLEAQKQLHPNLPKRARYYQAMMDIGSLRSGHDYLSLKNNYVIFICLHDLFKRGLPVYTFQNRCAEDTSILLGDCTTKIFLNAAKYDILEGNEELRAFMEYVKTGAATTDYTDRIDQLFEDLKDNPYWLRDYMDAKMQKAWQERDKRIAREEGFAEGEAHGAHDAQIATAQAMLADGIDVERTARLVNLPVDAVAQLVTHA